MSVTTLTQKFQVGNVVSIQVSPITIDPNTNKYVRLVQFYDLDPAVVSGARPVHEVVVSGDTSGMVEFITPQLRF